MQTRGYDGTPNPEIRREAYLAFDAALVLPYDPARDLVLLIEQLRYGPLWRGDPEPYTFEPVAGLIDAGESPTGAELTNAKLLNFQLTGAVPEPMTWALLILGFAGIGGAMRRKNSQAKELLAIAPAR